jgi:hypothetical protein
VQRRPPETAVAVCAFWVPGALPAPNRSHSGRGRHINENVAPVASRNPHVQPQNLPLAYDVAWMGTLLSCGPADTASQKVYHDRPSGLTVSANR